MVNVRARPDTGKLFFDFQLQGKRCREYTALEDSKPNRRRMEEVAKKIDAEITLGSFEYRAYFPNSKHAAKFDSKETSPTAELVDSPLLRDFSDTWWAENEIRWRASTKESNRASLNRHILPVLGDTPVHAITRADVLALRAEIAKLPGKDGNRTLTPKTINNSLCVLNMILTEAALRYGFANPMVGIKRLKQQKKDIRPFSLDEVRLIIDSVRADYRNYFTVRFFTGMRTAELHGLKWKFVDFENRQILVRETYARGRTEYTKTDGSQREIAMSTVVLDALKAQFEATGQGDYVFTTRAGTPLDTKNVTERVWYPLLKHLKLAKRRPYQCRHTAATLWLASGENPEWIAMQMGHTTTEMLFRVYSRYVPNLTRQDGSAFDRFVSGAMQTQANQEDEPA